MVPMAADRTSHDTRRPSVHRVLAALALAGMFLIVGCSKYETPDADVKTSDTGPVTSDTVPAFDSGIGYVPVGDPKIDGFCSTLAELDNNTILRNTDLALTLRVTVMLGTFDRAAPLAPKAIADQTAKLRDFLAAAAKIHNVQQNDANQEFIRLANEQGISAPLSEFLVWVRDNCKMTLDIDPTSDARARFGR